MTNIKKSGLPHIYTCVKCGKVVNPENYLTDKPWKHRMLADSICFECEYWLELIEKPDPHVQIINHQYFKLPPIVDEGGSVRHIMTKDGHLFDSAQLFNYGTIPQRFWDDLPDTASFVPHSRYRTIKANQGFECNRIGCWDRTQCFWFKGQMDWNKIPTNHKLGDEKCPMFINILNPKK